MLCGFGNNVVAEHASIPSSHVWLLRMEQWKGNENLIHLKMTYDDLE